MGVLRRVLLQLDPRSGYSFDVQALLHPPSVASGHSFFRWHSHSGEHDRRRSPDELIAESLAARSIRPEPGARQRSERR